jgi:hypothetical protein
MARTLPRRPPCGLNYEEVIRFNLVKRNGNELFCLAQSVLEEDEICGWLLGAHPHQTAESNSFIIILRSF